VDNEGASVVPDKAKPKRFRVLLDMTGITAMLGRVPEPKVDLETGVVQFDRDTGEQLSLVQLC
jgi:hypothetical protein